MTILLQPPSLEIPIEPTRPSQHGRTKRLLGYAVLIVAAAAILLPFYWMLISSLKANNDVYTIPVKWLPDPVVWKNYVDIWHKADMTTWLKNTLILSFAVTFLQVLTGSFAAYGFAKVRFPGRRVLFLAYLGTIAVPWQSYMIPQFILFSKLHLSDTLWSIVALQAFGAFGVFLMKQYYETIMLPLSVPAIASLSLLTLVTTWNDYLGPLIYLRSHSIWTIQIGLKTFVNSYNAEYSLIMTGSVLSVLPIAVIFLLGQRYFVEGIATTGLKG
jgi:multiple sugar transport system permease protein